MVDHKVLVSLTGAQINFEQKIRPILPLLAVLVLGFTMLFAPLGGNPDDLSIIYSQTQNQDLIQGNYINDRFVVSEIIRAITSLGWEYYDLIGTWISLLVLSIIIVCVEIRKLMRLPKGTGYVLALAAGTHGYMSELYSFTMGYAAFGVSLLATAAAMHIARQPNVSLFSKTVLATILGLIVLMSYQPTLLLYLFVPCLAIVANTLLIANPPSAIRESSYRSLIGGFVAAIVLFLTIHYAARALFPHVIPSAYRDFRIDGVYDNFRIYFQTIISPFASHREKYYNLFPLHERIVYGGSIIIAYALLLQAVKRRPHAAILSLLALTIGMALMPNPMNMFVIPFWPTPRSMFPASFFHAGLAIIVVLALLSKFRLSAGPYLWLIGAFLALSFANQISIRFGLYQQAQRDEAIGNSVLSEMRRLGTVDDNTTVAIVSTWGNVAQRKNLLYLDFAASAFTQPWSGIPLLRKVSGMNLRRGKSDPSACSLFKRPWEVRQQGGIFVVCMD